MEGECWDEELGMLDCANVGERMEDERWTPIWKRMLGRRIRWCYIARIRMRGREMALDAGSKKDVGMKDWVLLC